MAKADGAFIDPLLIVAPMVCVCVGGGLCLVLVLLFSTLCPSSVAITFMGKRELVAFLAWWSTQPRLATLLSSLIARRWARFQSP